MKKNEVDLSRFSKRKAGIRKNTNNAVIYTRVSSKEQADNYSLEVQDNATREYVERHNLTLKNTFGNTYESATSDIDRKEFERMMNYVKNPLNEIKYIVVYDIDRFSRTGGSAMALAEQLAHEHDITILHIGSPPVLTRSSADYLAFNLQLMMGQFVNDQRKERCVAGMKQALMNGDWPHKTPYGYDSVKKNGKREIVINSQGFVLRKAFGWRVNEKLSMDEISKRLSKEGVRLTYKRLHRIFENIFYAGILSSTTISGKTLEGNHEPIISLELFLKLREYAESFKKNKKIIVKARDKFPLIGTVRCACCNTSFTGYKKVKKSGNTYYYYKCNKRTCKLNRAADTLHEKFEQMLMSYSLPPWIRPLLERILENTFKGSNKANEESLRVMNTNLATLQKKLQSLEEKYIDDTIDIDMYTRYSEKIKAEIIEIKREINKIKLCTTSDLSNFLTHAISLSQNLSKTYREGTYSTRTTLQKTVFPDGVLYDRTIEGYRTQRVNEFFGLIGRLSTSYEKQKSGEISFKTNLSAFVARRGIEPLFPE